MSLRVIGGRFRGRRLASPPGRDTRPSSGRMRTAVFNMLGPRLPGASVLDLFAGTGASGIEALSRGARSVLFVEQARPALEALARNLQDLGIPPGEGTVLKRDVISALRSGPALEGAPFDLVLCDPPYDLLRDPLRADGLRRAIAQLVGSGALSAAGIVVFEHPADRGFGPDPQGLKTYDRRRYSAAGVSLLRPT